MPFLEHLEKSLVPRVGPGIAKKTREKLLELGEKKYLLTIMLYLKQN